MRNMKKQRRSLVLVIAASLFLFGIAARRPVVNIGLVVPLTGGAAVWGLETLRASQVMEKLMPSMNLHNDYRFLRENGQCGEGAASLTAAEKLVNIDKAHFLVVACSGAVLQVAPFANRAKALVIGQACGHPEISNAGDFIFRTDADFGRAMQLLSQHLKTQAPKKIAFLVEQNSFTLSLRDELKKNLGEAAIAATEEFPPKTTDFRTLLKKLQAKSPDALFIAPGAPETYEVMIRQIRELQVKQPILAYYLPGNASSRKNLGSLQEGVVFVDFHRPTVEESSPEYTRFRTAYREMFPDGSQEEWMTFTAYNALISYIQAIEAVGNDPEKVRNYLSDTPIHGAAGDFRFDKNGDLDINPYVLRRISGGEPAPID